MRSGIQHGEVITLHNLYKRLSLNALLRERPYAVVQDVYSKHCATTEWFVVFDTTVRAQSGWYHIHRTSHNTANAAVEVTEHRKDIKQR
jgi:hypothetical protein